MISFLKSLIRALDGDDDVFDFAFVASSVTELPYFATRTKIGKKRIEEVIDSDLQGLAKYEERAIKAIKPRVKVTIEKGITLLQRVSESFLHPQDMVLCVLFHLSLDFCCYFGLQTFDCGLIFL